MTTPLNDLSDMDLDRVALVDRGANPDAHMVLLKRDGAYDDNDKDKDTCPKCSKPMGKDHDCGHDGSVDKALDDAAGSLADAVSKIGRTLSANTIGQLTSLRDALGDMLAGTSTTTTPSTPETPPTVTATTETTQVEKSDDIQKRIDEAVAKALETQNAELNKKLADSEARVTAAETLAKQERDTRLDAEFAKRADAYTDVPGVQPAEFAKTLRTISEKVEGDVFKALTDVLDATAAAFKSGSTSTSTTIFGEAGRVTKSAGGDPMAEIKTAASELRKSDTALTEQGAIVKVMETRPELVTRYRENLGR